MNSARQPGALAPPDLFAIGDLQGCLAPLEALVARIESDHPAARFWFVGDLVNRGPCSLEALRLVRALQRSQRAVTVLGNHDLNLLAVAAGVRQTRAADTLDDILHAPDRDSLVDWLRHQPLVHYEHGHVLVHAGVPPAWELDEVLGYADEIQTALRGEGWRDTLAVMYGNEPTRWSPKLTGGERLRYIINGLTRMRFCRPDGTLDLVSTESADQPPEGFMPWFDVPGRAAAGHPIVFGHWSRLGLLCRDDLIALDTGCVWGGALSAMRLSDRRLWQQPCPQSAVPEPRRSPPG